MALVLLAALFTAPAWAEQTTVTSAAEPVSAPDNELIDTINITPGTCGGRFTAAENGEDPQPPVRPDNSSHSSGCNSGFGMPSLLPLFGLSVLKKK